MNNASTKSFRSAVAKADRRAAAENLVIRCGVRLDLNGSKFLTDAVLLYGSGTCDGFCEVYNAIAALRAVKPKTVMREISYAVDHAFGIREKLSRLVGLDIPASEIHTALVIAYLSMLLENRERDAIPRS